MKIKKIYAKIIKKLNKKIYKIFLLKIQIQNEFLKI